MTVPGVPKQSVAGSHLHPTTPAHSQLASQHLSSPQQLSTFIQASFPCCSTATNRTAPVPLTNLPQAKSFLQICVVWSPCTRARCATAFLDSSSAAHKRQPHGTVPGLEAAVWVGGWAQAEESGCPEGPKDWLLPGLPSLLFSYCQTSLWLTRPPHLSPSPVP